MTSPLLLPEMNIALVGDPRHGPAQLARALATPELRSMSVVVAPHRLVRCASETRTYTFALSRDGRSARDLGVADVAVVVVRARDGCTSITREHVMSALALGVPSIVVVINTTGIDVPGHIDALTDAVDAVGGDAPALLLDAPSGNPLDDDAVDAELIDACELDVRALLDTCGFTAADEVPLVVGRVASQTLAARLLDALDRVRPLVRDTDGALAISVRWSARHTPSRWLVSGVVRRGVVSAGQRVSVLGNRVLGAAKRWSSVVHTIEVGRQNVAFAGAGAVVGLMIDRGGEIDARSAIVADTSEENDAPGLTDVVDVDLALLTEARGGRHTPIFPGCEADVLVGSLRVACAIVFKPELAMPGDEIAATLMLRDAAFVERGARLLLRKGAHAVAMGEVTATYPWRRPSAAALARRATNRRAWWLPYAPLSRISYTPYIPYPGRVADRWLAFFRGAGTIALERPSELEALVDSGLIRADTQVRAPHKTDWCVADEVPQVARHFAGRERTTARPPK